MSKMDDWLISREIGDVDPRHERVRRPPQELESFTSACLAGGVFYKPHEKRKADRIQPIRTEHHNLARWGMRRECVRINDSKTNCMPLRRILP